MKQYNIYFGTIGNKLGVKYRFTKLFKSEESAKEFASNAATSFYYKNEGKQGIPSFIKISKESQLTGIDLETLYQDHINDMMRWYAIPTELDTISEKDLRY